MPSKLGALREVARDDINQNLNLNISILSGVFSLLTDPGTSCLGSAIMAIILSRTTSTRAPVSVDWGHVEGLHRLHVEMHGSPIYIVAIVADYVQEVP